jgi:FimV-like protein
MNKFQTVLAFEVEKSAMFIHNYINEFKLGSCVKRTGTLFASSMLMLVSQSSVAVGVGEAQVNSYLNTPLNIQMPITGISEDELRNLDVKLASYEQFQRLGINPQGLKRYQVKILNLNTGPTIVLTSDQPFKESYIEIAIVIRFAGGELVKAVSAFIDPAPTIQITNPVSGTTQFKTAINLAATDFNSESAVLSDPISQNLQKVEMAPVQIRQLKGARVWGPTQLNDSLWKVARRMRNDGLYDASLYQIMMAIFYDNQDAFYKGKIGQLKMAYMLRLPKIENVNRLTKSQALKLFQAASRGVVATRPQQNQPINPIRPIEVQQNVGTFLPTIHIEKSAAENGRSVSISRNLSQLAGTEQAFDIKALAGLQASIQSNKNSAIELKHQNEALKFQLAEIVMRLDRIQLQLEQDVAATQQLIQELNQKGLEVPLPQSPNQPSEREVNNVAAVLTGQRKLADSNGNSVINDKQLSIGDDSLEGISREGIGLEQSANINTANELALSGIDTVASSAKRELTNKEVSPLKTDSMKVESPEGKTLEQGLFNPATGQLALEPEIKPEIKPEKKAGLGMYILGFLGACVLAFLSMLTFYIIKRREAKLNTRSNPIIVRDEPLVSESESSYYDNDAPSNSKVEAAHQPENAVHVEQTELEDELFYQRKGMEFVADEVQDNASEDTTSNFRKELPAINRNKVQLDLIKTSAEAYLAYGRYDEAIELVDFETSQQTTNATLTSLLQKYLVELKIRVAELQNVEEPTEGEFSEDAIDMAVAAAVANAYAEDESDQDEEAQGRLSLDESELDAIIHDELEHQELEPSNEEYEYLESMQLLDDDEYDESVFDEIDDLDVEDSNSLSKKAS